MRRREFIVGLASAAALPTTVGVQQPAVPVVALLRPGQPGTSPEITAAFLEGLKEGRYVEGRNVAIEYRWAEGATIASPHWRPISFGGK
jgi:putative ABC transport system substrate-binding protein